MEPGSGSVTEVYLATWGRLRAIAAQRAPAGLAEDFVQAAWCRVLARPRAVGDLGAYVCKVMFHLIADYMRDPDRGWSEVDLEAAGWLCQPGASVEQLAMEREELAAVGECLGLLGARQRAVLELTAGGLGQREIGRALGMRPRAVRSARHYGRAALRRAMGRRDE